MISRQLFGHTGHLSSRVIFGAAAFSRVNQDAADRALEVLLEHGVNHIDTAARYGDSELRIGKWMARHRQDFFLATKTRERGYQAAWDDLRRSLDRLRVDAVDLWQFHNLVDAQEWEIAMGPDGVLAAAVEAKEQGLIRFIGVTGHGLPIPSMHRRSLERFAFDSVLLPYNVTMMRDPAVRRRRGGAVEGVRGQGCCGADDQVLGRWALGRDADAQHLVRAAGRTAGHRRRGALGARLPRRVS